MELNNRPFTVPSTKNARQAYADFYFSLVQFLVKTAPFAQGKAGFTCSLSAEQDSYANEVLLSFMAHQQNPLNKVLKRTFLSKVHKLSWSLFTSTYDSNKKTNFSDPVLQFLLAYFLKTSGQVLPPGLITPILAKMQFVMRIAYFHQCSNERLETGGSMLE